MPDLNATTTLKCFVNTQNISTNLTFKYCYRQVKYIMFGFNNNTSTYGQVGLITLPDIVSSDGNYTASVTMFSNYTFQPVTPTPPTGTTSKLKEYILA